MQDALWRRSRGSLAGIVVVDRKRGIRDGGQPGDSDALRAGPAVRNDSDSVRQPYPSRYYSDVSRGIKGCGWLMDRAIRTNNKNWLQRYRACSE
jgi:hypothetical protein